MHERKLPSPSKPSARKRPESRHTRKDNSVIITNNYTNEIYTSSPSDYQEEKESTYKRKSKTFRNEDYK